MGTSRRGNYGMATKITAKDVEHLAPGRHRAADNLYLTVSKAEARSWVFLYRWNGKSREAGLGKAGNGGVSLGEARRRAEEGRGMLRQKPPVDPLVVWRSSTAPRSPTFREAAEAHLARNEGAWKNNKHRAQWRMTLLGGEERNYCKKHPRSALRTNHHARRARSAGADLEPSP